MSEFASRCLKSGGVVVVVCDCYRVNHEKVDGRVAGDGIFGRRVGWIYEIVENVSFLHHRMQEPRSAPYTSSIV